MTKMSDGRLLVAGALAGLLLAGRVGSRGVARSGRGAKKTPWRSSGRPFGWREFRHGTDQVKRVLTDLDSRRSGTAFATAWSQALRAAVDDALRGTKHGNVGVLLRTFIAPGQEAEPNDQGGLVLIRVPFDLERDAIVILTALDLPRGSTETDLLSALGCLEGAPQGLVEGPISTDYFQDVVDTVLEQAPERQGSGSRGIARSGRREGPVAYLAGKAAAQALAIGDAYIGAKPAAQAAGYEGLDFAMFIQGYLDAVEARGPFETGPGNRITGIGKGSRGIARSSRSKPSEHIAKAGDLAYYVTGFSGILSVRVLRVYPDPVPFPGDRERPRLDIVVTSRKGPKAYPLGQEISGLSPNDVVPKKAARLGRTGHRSHVDHKPYRWAVSETGSRGIARSSKEQPRSRYKILARTGDANPFDHGGGIVFRDAAQFGGPGAADDPSISWWSWEGQDETEDEGARTYKVWQVNVPDDVLAEVWWVDDANLVGLASFVGSDVKTLRRMSKSNDVRGRVRLLETIGDYYGMANFDDQPVNYTQDELVEMFPELA